MIGIYAIQINNKYYVGQSVDVEKRLYKHRWALQKGVHTNKHLQRAFNLYEDMKAFVVKECTTEELDVWERILIRHFDSFSNGYNKATGGNKFKSFSEESKRKMSMAQKGNKKGVGHVVSAETRAVLSAKNKGKKPSPEAIRKVIERCTGLKLSREHRQKISDGVRAFRARKEVAQ